MLAIKTILHRTDFSERSDFAFRLACSLPRLRRPTRYLARGQAAPGRCS
jgi:hypothetical protein